MNDDLEDMGTKELSELVAVEVAGWTQGDVNWPPGDPDDTPGWIPPGSKSPNGYPCPPQFATDCNAVVPSLMAAHSWNAENFHDLCSVRVRLKWDSLPSSCSVREFPRAACIALIRAHRAHQVSKSTGH